MCLGTYGHLAQSLVTIYILARVHIIPHNFLIT